MGNMLGVHVQMMGGGGSALQQIMNMAPGLSYGGPGGIESIFGLLNPSIAPNMENASSMMMGQAQPLWGAQSQSVLDLLANPESLPADVQGQIVDAARGQMLPQLQATQRDITAARNAQGMADSGATDALQQQASLQVGGQLGQLSAGLAREGAIRRPEDIARAVGLAGGLSGQLGGMATNIGQLALGERGRWGNQLMGLGELGLGERERMSRLGLGYGGLQQQGQLGGANLLQNLFAQQNALGQQGFGNMAGLMGMEYGDPWSMIQNSIAMGEQAHQAHRQREAGGSAALGEGIGGGLGGLGSILGSLMPGGIGAAGAGAGAMAGGAGQAGMALLPLLLSSFSDRNLKENFEDVDAAEALEKVAKLPVETWNYKFEDADTRHMGPMAQDFQKAFGLGNSDKVIVLLDAIGVALAAIKGLNQKVDDLTAAVKGVA